MTIYIVFIILCLALSIAYDRKEEKSRFEQIAFWSLCVYLICLSGFSYRLGGDKQYYLDSFEYISKTSLTEYIYSQFNDNGFMPLWSAINYCVKQILNNFYVIQFLESFIINITICYYVRHYSSYHFLFLLIFFVSGFYFTINDEVMREGFSIAFGIIAIQQYLKNNYIWYIIFVTIAILFHISAIILFILPLCSFIKIERPHLILYIGICFVTWLLSEFLLSFVVPQIPILSSGIVEKVDQYSSMNSSFFGFVRTLFQYLIIPFIVGYAFLSEKKNEQLFDPCKTIISFQIGIGIIICGLGWGFIRFYNYVVFFYLIWIVNFIMNARKDTKFVLIKICSLILIAYFYVSLWLTPYPESNGWFYERFIPYTSFMDEDVFDYSHRVDIYVESVSK